MRPGVEGGVNVWCLERIWALVTHRPKEAAESVVNSEAQIEMIRQSYDSALPSKEAA